MTLRWRRYEHGRFPAWVLWRGGDAIGHVFQQEGGCWAYWGKPWGHQLLQLGHAPTPRAARRLLWERYMDALAAGAVDRLGAREGDAPPSGGAR